MSRTKLRLAKKLVFALIPTIALVTGIELACRSFGLGAARTIESYICDWNTKWWWKNGDLFFGKSDGGAEHFRDDEVLKMFSGEHPISKAEGTRRVVFLGDSVTWGWGIASEMQRFTWIVEQRLRDESDYVEVFNVSLGGWCPLQERIAYQRVGRKYQPDHVVLGICLNDIPEMQNNLISPPRFAHWLYRNSNLVRAISRPHESEIYSVRELFPTPPSSPVQHSWRIFFDEILRLRDDVAADGAEFSIVVFPFRFQVLPDAPDPLPQRKIGEFCREHRIGFLDALPAIKQVGADSFNDYDHFSPLGHSAVANEIIASGLLSGKASRTGSINSSEVR